MCAPPDPRTQIWAPVNATASTVLRVCAILGALSWENASPAARAVVVPQKPGSHLLGLSRLAPSTREALANAERIRIECLLRFLLGPQLLGPLLNRLALPLAELVGAATKAVSPMQSAPATVCGVDALHRSILDPVKLLASQTALLDAIATVQAEEASTLSALPLSAHAALLRILLSYGVSWPAFAIMLHWLEARLALELRVPSLSAGPPSQSTISALRSEALVVRRVRELEVGAIYCPGVYVDTIGGAGDSSGTPDDAPTLSPLVHAVLDERAMPAVLLLPPLGLPNICLIAASQALQVCRNRKASVVPAACHVIAFPIFLECIFSCSSMR